MARSKGYDGVICGHIHHPSIVNYNGIEYLNSGDWVETLSALVEDEKGDWHIVYYADLLKWEEAAKEQNRPNKPDKKMKSNAALIT